MKAQSRVAVVGSGISGLSAAYILAQRYDVHLFEAASRLGGHANTVMAGPERTPVDTGFIVFNNLNYPHLSAFAAGASRTPPYQIHSACPSS